MLHGLPSNMQPKVVLLTFWAAWALLLALPTSACRASTEDLEAAASCRAAWRRSVLASTSPSIALSALFCRLSLSAALCSACCAARSCADASSAACLQTVWLLFCDDSYMTCRCQTWLQRQGESQLKHAAEPLRSALMSWQHVRVELSSGPHLCLATSVCAFCSAALALLSSLERLLDA